MSDSNLPLPWTARARRLRRQQTQCESMLWSRLRNRQLAGRKFHRQFSIGPYIVDFLCQEHRLIVKVDGGQHAVSSREDAERTRWLEAQGLGVLRFWNSEVSDNLEGVLQMIAAALIPSPQPSPQGEGGCEPSPQGEGVSASERVRGKRELP